MSYYINGLFPGILEPDIIVGGCIAIYENVWPDPQETIDRLEKECLDPDSGAYWERAGTVFNGPFQNARTNKLCPVTHLSHINSNQVLHNIHNQFYISLLAATSTYISKFELNEKLYHEGYSVLKYKNNEQYRSHYDGDTSIARVISAVCYLNDDYDGGELEFVNFGIKIKPEAGMLILFPSNFAYRHIAYPVTNGTKYAVVTWLRDQPI
jgi:hypothetical protein